MERLTTVPVEDVVEAMRQGKNVFIVAGIRLGIGSARLKTYLKGTTCVHCGKEAHYFAVEKHTNATTYHLNLYHKTEKGGEIMITSDHIVAKANGGSNSPKNRQAMCFPCNNLKSDYDSIEEAKNAKKLREAERNSPKTIMSKINKCVTTQLYAASMIESGDKSRNWKRIAVLAVEAIGRHIRHLQTVKC